MSLAKVQPISMSLPNRNNPYNFDEYLEWLNNFNLYEDVPFIKQAIKTYAGELSPEILADLKQFGEKHTNKYKKLSDAAGVHEKAPYLVHFDGHNNRIDRIVRPPETLELEREWWQDAVFADDVHPWSRFIKIYLMMALGEAGVNCAHCCTSGLILLLDKFADTPELKRIHQHLTNGIDGDFAIGGQFLSEMQGGSDVQANLVEAVPQDDGSWKIYGTKYYTSAAHCDYAVITAKPTGSEKIAMFVVPSWLPGDKEKEKRNSYVINKIKSKLGTRELPTGEICYNGSIAYALGPLEDGLSNIIGIVLSHSRFMSGTGPGAQMLRVVEEARKYAELRTAFGVTINKYGLVAAQFKKLDKYAQRTTATSFKLQSEILKNELMDAGQKMFHSELAEKHHRFHLRMLIMLHKMVATTDAVMVSELAMSMFGGHGLMECFSHHPRLYRDAVTLSGAWEGPKNLLLTRIFMDIQAATKWYPMDEFIRNLLTGAPDHVIVSLIQRLNQFIDHGTLLGTDDKTIEMCEKWEQYCFDLTHAYQDVAHQEVLAS